MWSTLVHKRLTLTTRDAHGRPSDCNWSTIAIDDDDDDAQICKARPK